MILIEGFIDYSILSYNIEDNSTENLIVLDGYSGNLAQSYSISPNNYIVWNSSNIYILDISNDTIKSIADSAMDIQMYDINKIAILKFSGIIEFYSFTSDTLLYENSITLQYHDPVNFSISNSADILVYQANTFEGMGKIILLNKQNNQEKVLFTSDHKEQ